jgi:hypothetical protein
MKKNYLLLLFLLPCLLAYKTYTDNEIPGKRAHHALIYDEATKMVILTGGSTPLDGGRSFVFYNDIWQFNGSSWKSLGNIGDKRSGIGLSYDSKLSKVISFGGFSGNNSLSQLSVFENSDWKTLSDVPEMAVAEGGFVYDIQRDSYIAFGGSKGMKQVSDETWEWNGTEWKKLEITNPEARQAFAMVYDSKRNKTVLFGGMGSTPQSMFNDTWEYDGKSWTKVDTAGPGARVSSGYTYDSKRGLFIIFGGMSSKGMLGDTWAWNGKNWQKLSDTGPAARAMGYMAYNKDRDQVVLFGGRLGWPNDVNDTWIWNGKRLNNYN